MLTNRANDGLTLYGCSADGTICALSFRKDEFPELGAPDMTQKILDEYGYKPARKRKALTLAPSSGFIAPTAGGEEKVNMLQPRKGKPKPMRKINLAGTMTGGAVPNGRPAMGSGGSGGRPPLQRPDEGGRAPLQRPTLHSEPARGGALDAFARAADEPLSVVSGSAATARMLGEARGVFDYDSDRSRAGDKRKASMDDDHGRPPKGRSLGASRALQPVQEIRAPMASFTRVGGGGGGSGGQVLPTRRLQTGIQTNQDDGNGVFKAENDVDREQYSVTFSQGGNDLWMDFIPSPVVVIKATSQFCAAGCADGAVRVYSAGGRL